MARETQEPENDYAVCLECGAEDVWFRPHNEGCTEAGDIIVKSAPEWQTPNLLEAEAY